MKTIIRVLFSLLLAGLTPAFAGPTGDAEPSRSPAGPSEQLVNEHRIIMIVVDATKREITAMRKDDAIDDKRVRKLLDFFTNFVDRCHHAKEERFYFPAARYHDSEEIEAMVNRLQIEHDFGRSILEVLRYALDYDDYNTDFIAERLEQYAAVLAAHISKEDRILFPKADIRIAGAEERAILKGFSKIEEVELGSGFHEKYHEMARELAEQE